MSCSVSPCRAVLYHESSQRIATIATAETIQMEVLLRVCPVKGGGRQSQSYVDRRDKVISSLKGEWTRDF